MTEPMSMEEFEWLIDDVLADGVSVRPPGSIALIAAYRTALEELARLREERRVIAKQMNLEEREMSDAGWWGRACARLLTERDALKMRVKWLERQPVPLNRAQRSSNIYQTWLAQEPKEHL